MADTMDLGSIAERREGSSPSRCTSEADSLAQAKLFFSSVSHDIRTPLNAIIGYAELLKLGISDPKEREKALDAIVTSGRTLLELINDVLDISKLDAGAMTIVPKPTKCDELAADIVATFGHEALKRGISVVAETVGDIPVLMVDPQRLRQILFNLVGNAVKFTKKGSVRVRVGYSSETLTIRVVDTGVGMKLDELDRIMLPFAQASNTVAGGTGLGLAICNGLAKRMGGSITVRSVYGKGSAFIVSLKGVEKSDRSSVFHVADIDGAANLPRIRDLRILIVDDSPVNRAVLSALIARVGKSEVVECESGAEALAKLQSERFDLVLSDLWMPGMSGVELARRIRAVSALKDMPVYAVTADVEARRPEVESMFTGLLLKPVTLARVSQMLSRI